ncbi:MAG TPA: hypothetical protein DCR55_06560 [Lentisphaeria bacterium]|nr:hypothetical protein [Lentisphaeria bacterium]
MDLALEPKHFRITDLPEESRPRERLHRLGGDALSTEELLAIILRTGTPRRSALDIARQLLHNCDNDLARLATADSADLTAVSGIGAAKSAHLKAIFSLAKRMADAKMQRSCVASPAEAAAYFRLKFLDLQTEQLRVLLLDTKSMALGDFRVTEGLVNQVPIHAREVFRRAVQLGATKIVLAHNHPSGDPTPSAADIQATKKMVEAGKVLDIPLVDHVILGRATEERPRDYFSLREAQLI